MASESRANSDVGSQHQKWIGVASLKRLFGWLPTGAKPEISPSLCCQIGTGAETRLDSCQGRQKKSDVFPES